MKQRRQPYRHWTAEEDQIIIDSLHRPDGVRFAIDTLTPTSTLFGGRTVCSIFSRRAYLGRDVDRTNSVRKFLAWTLEESKKLKTLIDQNQGLQPHELREHFPGRTLSALAQRYWIITKEKRRAETLRIPHLESESDSQQKSEATEGKENSRYDPVRQRPWVQEENERIHQHFETLQRAAASKLVARTSPLSPSSPPFLSTSLSSLSPMPSPPLPTVTATDLVESLMSDPKWDRLYSVTVLRVKRMLKGLLAPQSRNQQQHGNDRQYLPSCSTHWTKDEEARIISAVADQVGSEYRPQLCFQGSNFQFPPKPAFGRVPLYSGQSIACQEEVAEKETRRKRPYLTPGSPALDRIDWQLVADKVETRTAGNCRQRFYNNLSIRSKIAWDAKELKRLDEGLTKFGPDMQALSIYVGTRSPRQCQNKLWYLDMQERKWSQKK
ncbi:hypothetical protein BGZ83_010410 [Gryganskiella cystojenkinii]|nr:hypothetical protein BGZ83_010410 [Gryganskiella cystojenkinii]